MTGGIIGLFIIDFRMTVLVLLFIPIKCVVMKYFAKKQKQIMDEFIKRNQEYAKWFGDTVGGYEKSSCLISWIKSMRSLYLTRTIL